jgi:hypothetical protein
MAMATKHEKETDAMELDAKSISMAMLNFVDFAVRI